MVSFVIFTIRICSIESNTGKIRGTTSIYGNTEFSVTAVNAIGETTKNFNVLINIAIDELNDELQNHPDIVLMIQKIHADEEIKNNYVDQNEDYSELKKCFK